MGLCGITGRMVGKDVPKSNFNYPNNCLSLYNLCKGKSSSSQFEGNSLHLDYYQIPYCYETQKSRFISHYPAPGNYPFSG